MSREGLLRTKTSCEWQGRWYDPIGWRQAIRNGAVADGIAFAMGKIGKWMKLGKLENFELNVLPLKWWFEK